MDYSKIKILIADDIMLNTLLVKKALASHPYQITTASNGQQALDAIMADQPDLLLLDLMMPGIDGFEVIRRVRAGEAGNPNLRIVILSALNSDEDRKMGLEAGANDFIIKPIVIPQLLDVVDKQLNEIFAS